MNLNSKKIIQPRIWIAIAVVLVIGVFLAGLILMTNKTTGATDEHGHGDAHGEANGEAHGDAHGEARGEAHGEAHGETHKAEDKDHVEKGPHGGKLFTQNAYGLEVTIFEANVGPEFRIYTYNDGKALAPTASKVTVTLERLGRAPQIFQFVAEKDYLKGTAIVEEPHSFQVKIAAGYAGKSYSFYYKQVESQVGMSDVQLKQSGVELATVGPARIQSGLTLAGEVRLNQDRMVQIVPRLTGLVESVAVNAGDKVQKGQLLAVLSSQVLVDLRSELLAAQKRFALARSSFEREKKLWEEKISAEQDYLQARNTMQEAEITLQSAQQKLASFGISTSEGGRLTGNLVGNLVGNLARYEVRSPIAGTVTEKHIAIGQSLKDDTPIFIVADLSGVWVEMTVPAKDVNIVKVGQKAIVSVPALGVQASGSLSYVGSLVGEQSRTAIARLVLANPNGQWRPGLPVSVELVSDETEVPVAVSVDAIQTLKDSSTVFGRYGDIFEARPVELGRRDGKFVEVLKGLNVGERYAAKNSFLIKADIGKSGASHDH